MPNPDLTSERRAFEIGERMEVVRGGGFTLLTDDVILKAVVRKCTQLEDQLRVARHDEVARYRTLRRDVSQIKKKVFSDVI